MQSYFLGDSFAVEQKTKDAYIEVSNTTLSALQMEEIKPLIVEWRELDTEYKSMTVASMAVMQEIGTIANQSKQLNVEYKQLLESNTKDVRLITKINNRLIEIQEEMDFLKTELKAKQEEVKTNPEITKEYDQKNSPENKRASFEIQKSSNQKARDIVIHIIRGQRNRYGNITDENINTIVSGSSSKSITDLIIAVTNNPENTAQLDFLELTLN